MHLHSLRKVHSFTGLFPLGAYLLFHAYEHFPVRSGRDAVVDRLAQTTSVPLEIVFVMVPLLVHGLLGLHLSRKVDDSPAYASPSFRRFQLYGGVATGLFLVLHVSTVWVPRALTGRPATAYGALVDQVGTLPGAALYAFFATATCAHFAQGLSATLVRSRAPGTAVHVARWLCLLLGVLLWGTFINELAAYATGASLL